MHSDDGIPRYALIRCNCWSTYLLSK